MKTGQKPGKNNKLFQYVRAYKWSNIFAMIRNMRRDPEICEARFDGKLVVITGATSGIGYFTARKYAAQGANLLCINRNPEKSEKLRREIETEFAVKCEYKIANLSRLKDIFRVSRELSELPPPIDVLIHNAGNYLTKRELNSDGLEKVFVVHYLSSFIMNYLLTDKLKAQEKSRILMVSSEGHRFAVWGLRFDDLNWEKRRYSGLKSYGSAKTAQLLSMLIFEEQFRGSAVTINTMHPGAVKTDTGQENGRFYRWYKRNFLDKGLRTADISAEALYYLGAATALDGVSGKFFNLTTVEEPAPPAADMDATRELWDQTLKMTGLAKQA
ncbi:MAG: SDR family NAD(P)-dependent oxidoreductase [Candidatus Neomarinimicrobiota bacterium]|jgi:NAD(P)-dependent dehydrogenase (short-subunit alcohol dehydrogenase family)